MTTVLDKISSDRCTGCGSCFNLCPTQAIQMIADEYGFLHPTVEKKNCIDCSKCIDGCPANALPLDIIDSHFKKPIVNAAWSDNIENRVESTSGGVFSEIAKYIFSNNGYVVGAIYDDDFSVRHFTGRNINDILKLRQSKYVQSDKKNVFCEIKSLINEDVPILFVGAPCEVSGLYKFLEQDYSNLYTMDFICLGANSPKAYRAFLTMLEQKYKSKIKRIWFKNKIYGWHRFSTYVELENKCIYLKDRYHDYYMRGYIGERKLYIRPVCSACQYKDMPRVADLSLGDFWGIENVDSTQDQDLGTSAVLINSLKGKNLFVKAARNIKYKKMNIQDVVSGNPALFNCAKIDEEQIAFFKDLENMRFDEAIEKYCPLTFSMKKNLFINRIKNRLLILSKKYIIVYWVLMLLRKLK